MPAGRRQHRWRVQCTCSVTHILSELPVPPVRPVLANSELTLPPRRPFCSRRYSQEGDFSIGGALSSFWRSVENFRSSASNKWYVTPAATTALQTPTSLYSHLFTLTLWCCLASGAAWKTFAHPRLTSGRWRVHHRFANANIIVFTFIHTYSHSPP
jgi:hypothetical protein